jgi:hypothetical protein
MALVCSRAGADIFLYDSTMLAFVCVCACARAAEGTDYKRPLEAARASMTSNLSKQALGRFGGARYSGPLGVAVLMYQSSILRMRTFLPVFVVAMAAARLVCCCVLYVASTAGSVPLCVESIARSVMNFDALLC